MPHDLVLGIRQGSDDQGFRRRVASDDLGFRDASDDQGCVRRLGMRQTIMNASDD